MIDILNSAAMERALATLPSSRLRTLLSQRLTQLTGPSGGDLAVMAHFVIVEPHDAPSAVESTLGFSIGIDHADFAPSWEWIADHGGWFELAFILTDDGFAHVLFVQDHDDVDASLLAMCREHGRATDWSTLTPAASRGIAAPVDGPRALFCVRKECSCSHCTTGARSNAP